MRYKKFGELSREEQLALFAAWLDGKAIEFSFNPADGWASAFPYHTRLVLEKDRYYRIKPPIPATKPFVDWSQVAPQFKWMATDSDGTTWIYTVKPAVARHGDTRWSIQDTNNIHNTISAAGFASFKPGNVEWWESLVERPKDQE